MMAISVVSVNEHTIRYAQLRSHVTAGLGRSVILQICSKMMLLRNTQHRLDVTPPDDACEQLPEVFG